MVSHDNRTWIWNNHGARRAQICGWRICAKFFVPPNFRLPHPLHWLQLDKCPQFYGRVSFLILVCSKWTHVFIAKSSTDMQLTASYHYFTLHTTFHSTSCHSSWFGPAMSIQQFLQPVLLAECLEARLHDQVDTKSRALP